MKAKQIEARIISNQKRNGNYGHLEFESAVIAQQAQPGQFVNIQVNNAFDPLLRRPISIHGVSGSKVKIIYKIIGKGTQVLSQRRPGEFLDIIGPLGHGFDCSRPDKSSQHKNIIVAGGMGVAPLVFLAEKLKLSKPLVLVGAATKAEILCLQEFKALGCVIKIATDDGSAGFKGRVTDLLNIVLGQVKSASLFSCGPQPMLKAVARIAHESKIPAQLSLEAHMACGVGACLGCEVLTKTGYKSVCKDGPVFGSEELAW